MEPIRDDSTPSTFGQILRRHRRASGLTQEQLAEQSGISVRAIGNLERGVERRPRLSTFELLAEALHLSAHEYATWQATASLEGRPTAVGRLRNAVTLPVIRVQPRYPLPTQGPFVGRTDALRYALDALPGSAFRAGGEPDSDSPRLLLIAGEAGLGKTRFLAEIARQGQEHGLLVLAGGCYEAEGRLPLAAFHDAVLDYIQTQSDDVLQLQLEGVLPDLVRVVPELRDRFPELPEADAADREEQRLRLFWTMARVFGRMCEAQPLVLLLDDLQWSDETTLQLMHFLIRQPHLDQMLIVGTYRPGEIPETDVFGQFLADGARVPGVLHIALQPLDEPDLARLLGARLGGTCAPRLAREIHERSDGNPFFGLQIVGLLQQEGRLERGHTQTGDAWHMKEGTDLDLPAAVRDTVVRRLRQLQPDVIEVLQLAGVAGRHVAYATLKEIWEGGERALLRALDAALSAQILEETEIGYAFRHPVLREVVCRQLSAARRVWLHAQLADALETMYEEKADEHAAQLAHHIVAGGIQGPRALRYLVLAAEAAARTSAWEEALSLYRTALQHATTDRAAAEVQEHIGGVLRALGRYDDALAALDEAVERYDRAGDLRRAGEVTAEVVQVHALRGTWEEGRARATPVLAQLERLSPRTRELSQPLAELHLALTYLYDAGPEERLHTAERAAQLARALADDGLLADAEMRRALFLFSLRRLPEAQQVIEALMPLAEVAEDSTTLRFAVDVLSDIHKLSGRFEQCLRCRERALAYAEERPDEPHWIMVSLAQLGEVLFLLGDWPAARSRHEQAVEMARVYPAPHYAAFAFLGLGALQLAEGRSEEASQHIETCLSDARSTNDLHWVRNAERLLAYRDLLLGRPDAALRRLEEGEDHTGTLYLRAWAYLELGDILRAAQTVERSIVLATDRNNRLDLCEALIVQGRIYSRQRQLEEAEHSFVDALSLARSMPYPFAEARTLDEWGRTLTAYGKRHEAREPLEKGLRIFQRLGARPFIEQTDQAFRELEPC